MVRCSRCEACCSLADMSFRGDAPTREEPAKRMTYPPPRSPYFASCRRKSPRRKSPLRDRVTVSEWLASPERGRSQENQRHLPTFEELMRRDGEAKKTEVTHVRSDLDFIPTSEKSSSLRDVDLTSKPSPSANRPPIATQVSDVTKSDAPSPAQRPTPLDPDQSRSGPPGNHPSSLLAQVGSNDSYQNTLMSADQPLQAPSDASAQRTIASDLELHRRAMNPPEPSDDRDPLASKSGSTTATSLTEFQLLDEAAQRQLVMNMLQFFRQKSNSQSTSSNSSSRTKPSKPPKKAQPASSRARSDLSTLHETSCVSNEAVCDSDSTEYCDLPSSRHVSSIAIPTDDSSSRLLLGVDENKAEVIMKRLLKKIESQKAEERRKKQMLKR